LNDERIEELGTTVVHISSQDPAEPDREVTEHVAYALGGALAESGLQGAEPVLPPTGLAEGHLGVQAAWTALLGHYRRRQGGDGPSTRGSTVSLVEAAAEALAGPGGTPANAGSVPADADAGASAVDADRARSLRWIHENPDAPSPRGNPGGYARTFRCAGGHVRLSITRGDHWRKLADWCGDEAAFGIQGSADQLDEILVKDAAEQAIAGLCLQYSASEFVEEAGRCGIPVGVFLRVSEVVRAAEFRDSGTLRSENLAPDVTAVVPPSPIRIDGERVGIVKAAPVVGEDQDLVLSGDFWPVRSSAAAVPRAKGFDSLRILDGSGEGESRSPARHFAGLGAEVVRLHRGGLGADPQTERDELLKAVSSTDVIFTGSEGISLTDLDVDEMYLRRVNPSLVLCDVSAFDAETEALASGADSALVRAASGVTALWGYPNTFSGDSDSATDYPSATAALVAATASLAGLIESLGDHSDRRRDQPGTSASVAKIDVALHYLGGHLAEESLLPHSVEPEGNIALTEAPSGVFPCAGDDRWCVVSVRDDHDWASLCGVVDRPDLVDHPILGNAEGRVENRAAAVGVLTQWLLRRDAERSIDALREGKVPVGDVLHRGAPAPERLHAEHMSSDPVH
jgi:crotonobetainyl-CoA:carnitine CoA-transferase CaiB-like acyl-CoA transferase